MQDIYDVLVVGGGFSGAIAAIPAARCGARTIILLSSVTFMVYVFLWLFISVYSYLSIIDFR